MLARGGMSPASCFFVGNAAPWSGIPRSPWHAGEPLGNFGLKTPPHYENSRGFTPNRKLEAFCYVRKFWVHNISLKNGCLEWTEKWRRTRFCLVFTPKRHWMGGWCDGGWLILNQFSKCSLQRHGYCHFGVKLKITYVTKRLLELDWCECRRNNPGHITRGLSQHAQQPITQLCLPLDGSRAAL